MFRENVSSGGLRLLQSPNSTRLLRNCWIMGNWRARNDIVYESFSLACAGIVWKQTVAK